MAIRHDPDRIQQRLEVEGRTKQEIRQYILNQWANETSGSKYRYFVGTLADDQKIYLERPGNLNKGCDFVIYMENLVVYQNGNDRPPTLDYLLNDLRDKKAILSQQSWNELFNSIRSVYSLEVYSAPHNCENEIRNCGGMNLEQILVLCKWFFIEQDITYWNGSGRQMLFSAIKELNQHNDE